MCGRYVSTASPDQLADHFRVDEVLTGDLGRRFNVAPTVEVYVVRDRGDEEGTTRALAAHRWGLVPFWADSPAIGSKMINARAETLTERPAFRRALERRRCLVPADGFYEWQRRSGGRGNQPYFLRRADGAPMAFAGLWEVWHDAEDRRLLSCTVVTSEANDDVRDLHDRMPVLVAPSDWDRWLDRQSTDPGAVADLLAPTAVRIDRIPVSTDVNDVANDGPHLLEPHEEMRLF